MFHTGDRILPEGWGGSAVGKAFAVEMWRPMFRSLRPVEKLVLVTCECNLGAPTAGWEGQAGEPREPGVHQENRKGETPFQTRWKARPKAQGCPHFHTTAMTDAPAVTHMTACTYTIHGHTNIVADFTWMKFTFTWGPVGFLILIHPMLYRKHRLWYKFCIANLENSGYKINLTFKYSHLTAPERERAVQPV